MFIVENKPRIHNLAFTQLSLGNMNDAKEQKCNRKKLERMILPTCPQSPMVVYCNSGVTACAVALAAHICGNTDVAVYDGSWNEWKANH